MDNQVFETTTQIANVSLTLRNLMIDCDLDADEEMPIPLHVVNSTVLVHILRWMEHHQNDPELVEDDKNASKRTDDIEQWDRDFLNVEQSNNLTAMYSSHQTKLIQKIYTSNVCDR